MLVYRLARYRNAARSARGRFRARVIEREPSAELRPDQKDTDSLPPYEVLDRDPRGLHRGRPVGG